MISGADNLGANKLCGDDLGANEFKPMFLNHASRKANFCGVCKVGVV